MQHVLIDRHVAFHGMRAQAVGQHNVVDVVAGTFDSIVELTQLAGSLLVGNGFDPTHAVCSVWLLGPFGGTAMLRADPNLAWQILSPVRTARTRFRLVTGGSQQYNPARSALQSVVVRAFGEEGTQSGWPEGGWGVAICAL